MESFAALFASVQQNAAGTLLVLALMALGYIYRDQRQREELREKERADLNAAHLKAMESAFAAHLQTALQVAPLASKLVTCVELLERMSAARAGS